MPTLLEKIKSQKPPTQRWKVITKEDEDVAIAWMNNVISESQIARTLKEIGERNQSTNIYSILSRGLKSAFHNGRIKII